MGFGSRPPDCLMNPSVDDLAKAWVAARALKQKAVEDLGAAKKTELEASASEVAAWTELERAAGRAKITTDAPSPVGQGLPHYPHPMPKTWLGTIPGGAGLGNPGLSGGAHSHTGSTFDLNLLMKYGGQGEP